MAMLCGLWATLACVPAQACWQVAATAGQMQATDSVMQGCFASPADYQSAVLGYMNVNFTSVSGRYWCHHWVECHRSDAG